MQEISRDAYIRKILDAYRQTPGTAGTVRRPDRLLAEQLYARGVPLSVVENALVLAASRRILRPADALPLNTIRSLAYFSPVIEEVLELRVSPEYFQYLRHRIQRSSPPAANPDAGSQSSQTVVDDVNPDITLSRG